MFALGASVLVTSPAGAQKADLEHLTSDIARVGAQIQTLIEEHRQADISRSYNRFSSRLTEAEISFLLQDYPGASVILFELVNDPKNEEEATFGKALYYLAEAQFEMGNDIAARTYFRRMVERRDKENLAVAIRRLIELADRSRDWQGLDERVDVLRTRGALPPSIAYIHAKSLLRQRKLDQVEVAVRDIPERHPLRPKADFLVAVTKLLIGDFEAARRGFALLTAIGDDYDDAGTVRELAKMNRARIYVEEGNLPDAIDAYQEISRHSPYFEESLYEITWSHVRAASRAESEEERVRLYGKALKALEILLLTDTGTTLAPEARILLGNILLRLGRHDDATAAFAEVVDRYEPVRKELKALAVDVTDPIAYYDEIVERSRTGGDLLPPLAIKWAAEQRELRDALGVVNDLEQGEAWLEESRQVLDKLMAVLGSERRSQFFPALNAARGDILEIENTLLTLSHRLLMVEREIVGDELDASARAALETILAERAKLEPEYRALPQKKADYEGRMESQESRMQTLQTRAFRLRWEIEEMRRGIDGLRQWANDNEEDVDEATRSQLRARLEQADREVRQLEKNQDDLAVEISKERSLITLAGQEQSREEQVRLAYAETLAQEQEILMDVEDRVTGSDRELVQGVIQQRDVLLRYTADLEGFDAKLERRVAELAASILTELSAEKAKLDENERAIAAAREEAKRVVGEVAIDSLRDVEVTFENIVLRGDVGILDVAWALKERKTHEINHLVSKQRQEIAILDGEFQEIADE